MPVEPCHLCGTPTARWCGTQPCCWPCHLTAFPTYAQRGQPGRARPDHGPDQYDLTCHTCQATWVGPAWDPCDWCTWRAEAMVDGQRTLLLMEPELEYSSEDKDIERAGQAWSDRLAIGVEAGLITAQEADRAVIRWMKKVAAWR